MMKMKMLSVMMIILVMTGCSKTKNSSGITEPQTALETTAEVSNCKKPERKVNCQEVCLQEKKRNRCLTNQFMRLKLKRTCDQLYGNNAFPDFERLRMDGANLRDYAYVRIDIDGLAFYLPMLRSLIPEDNKLPILNAALAYCACDQLQEGDMLRFVKLGRYNLYWCNSCTDCEMTENDR